jgi:hypothetical protein
MRRAEVLLCMTLAGPLAGATCHVPTGHAVPTFATRRPPLAGYRAHVAAVPLACRDHAVDLTREPPLLGRL